MYIPLKPLFSRHNGIGVQFTDEPTGNLNSEAADEVMELLKKCVRDFDRTVIMITHNEALIGDCDRILHIRDGVLTEEKHNEK